MYQFFVEPGQIQDGKIIITGGDVNHIRNVLRMKPGEEIAVSNGIDGREYRCGIETFTENEVICSLRFIKAVELGVYEVIPVTVRRCVVKLDGKKAAGKVGRWQGIAEAAAKQSKRGIIPQVHSVMGMREAVEYASGMEVKLIP